MMWETEAAFWQRKATQRDALALYFILIINIMGMKLKEVRSPLGCVLLNEK